MEITLNPGLLPVRETPTEAEADGGAAQSADADFDSFLKLLTAQLRNQDPLQPIDSTEFVAQLASFSTVEQLIGTNDRLDALADRMAASDVAAYASWIGREVAAVDGSAVATGEPIGFRVAPVPGADRVIAEVTGANGRPIARIDLAAGVAEAVWDGRDADGAIPVGEQVAVTLAYLAGEEILERRPALVERLVTGIAATDAGPRLELADGGRLAPEAVTRIGEVPAPPAEAGAPADAAAPQDETVFGIL